jgi:uncharacterized membrane protein YdjX (TVP38/TMEM64 family)
MPKNKLIVAGTIIAAALFVALTLPVKEYLGLFLRWVDGLGAWGPVLVGAAYIPATVLFIPGSVLTLGAGALFGVAAGTVAVSLGSTAGSTAAFLAGRFFARDWVAHKVKGNAKFEAIDRAVARNGFKIVLLTRLSPIFPYNMLGYAYGITDVTLGRYVIASWIGMLPGTLMYVYLGSLAGSVAAVATGDGTSAATGGYLEWGVYGIGLVATVTVTVLVTRIAAGAMRELAPELAASSSRATSARDVTRARDGREEDSVV